MYAKCDDLNTCDVNQYRGCHDTDTVALMSNVVVEMSCIVVVLS